MDEYELLKEGEVRQGSVFTTAITYVNERGDFAVGKRHRRYMVVAWMPLPEPYREE